jgi:hypothetical protein
MKKLNVLLFLFSIGLNIFCQTTPTSKGAFNTSLTGNFIHNKPTENDEIETMMWSFDPEVNYFIKKNFHIGLGMEYYGEKIEEYFKHSFAIGPNIGYARSIPKSIFIPYAEFKYRRSLSDTQYSYNIDNKTKNIFAFHLGTILEIHEHFGLKIDAGYNYIIEQHNTLYHNTRFHQFKINIGVIGLFYKAG